MNIIDSVQELERNLHKGNYQHAQFELRNTAREIGAALTKSNSAIQVELEEGRPNWNVAVHQIIDGQDSELRVWLLAGVLSEGIIALHNARSSDPVDEVGKFELQNQLTDVALEIQSTKVDTRESAIQAKRDFKNHTWPPDVQQ